MRISLADLPASSTPSGDVSVNISGGGMIPTADYGTGPGPMECLAGKGPLAPGQMYCPGVLENAAVMGTVAQPATVGLFAGMSTTTLAMIAVAGVALLMMAGGRRR